MYSQLNTHLGFPQHSLVPRNKLTKSPVKLFRPDASYYRRAVHERGANIDISDDEQDRITRIRKMFGKVELSISSYDTAWVAMVPSRSTRDFQQPSFPQCLDWILQNQNPNGSWGLHPTHPSLVQDCLSSTLACVLALEKWKVGELVVNKGLDFIRSRSWAVNDKHQYSPIGFDIIFSGMIGIAKEMGVNLPLDPILMDEMLQNKDHIIARASVNSVEDIHLAYVAEGLGKSHGWNEAITMHQRRNGSLFNSPSTTAAALIHLNDDKCYDYLCSLLKLYKNAVPAIYPLDIYTRLCLVDRLDRLGIARFFSHEIESVLIETYRLWMERNEEIVLDVACRAKAFRLLRMNGYEVPSESLEEFDEQEKFLKIISPQFTDSNTILELFRASQITISQQEPILERLNGWTSSFLKQEVVNQTIQGQRLQSEVMNALHFPKSQLERLESRKNIELCQKEALRIVKTCYMCSNVDNRDLYELSLKDFNTCQSIYQEELRYLERWWKENRLQLIKPARQMLTSSYFAIVSGLSAPELSQARISWTKNFVLSGVVDDLLDCGTSREESLNLIELIEKWDDHATVGYSSEHVEIIFAAIYSTINELAAEAFKDQGRCVKHHFIDLWVHVVKCMMREQEWATKYKPTPTFDEYISNGAGSVALGVIVVIASYFVVPKLSDEVLESAEYKKLYTHTSLISRLSNDLGSFKREMAQGKLNSVPLYIIQSEGKVSEEDAVKKIAEMIETNRRELLRMVINTTNGLVPKVCKDFFWHTNVVSHYFYKSGKDEYTSPTEILADTSAVIRNKIESPTVSLI